jgi:hypothetical protein
MWNASLRPPLRALVSTKQVLSSSSASGRAVSASARSSTGANTSIHSATSAPPGLRAGVGTAAGRLPRPLRGLGVGPPGPHVGPRLGDQLKVELVLARQCQPLVPPSRLSQCGHVLGARSSCGSVAVKRCVPGCRRRFPSGYFHGAVIRHSNSCRGGNP